MVTRNITKLGERLWVGGDLVYSPKTEVDRMLHLQPLVIDVRDAEEVETEPSWRSLGLDGIHVEMHDDPKRGTTMRSFLEFFEIVQPMSSQKLFIHCHMGINRSPSAAWFLMVMDGWMKPAEAFDIISQKRPFAGMAYVTEALKAVMSIRNVERKQRPVMLKEWEQYQERHWTTERQRKINDAIHERRKAYEKSDIWMDDDGVLHGTAG